MSGLGRTEGDRRRAGWFGIAATALLLGACDSLEPLRNVNPELSDARAFLWPRTQGVVEITASPADPSFRLPRRGRVGMKIATSAGDSESVALYRLWCPPHRALPLYACHSLVLVTRPGVNVTELETRVVDIGGRFSYVSEFSPDWAVVIFPAPSGLMARRQQLLDWAEVSNAGLEGPGCVECGPEWLNAVQAELAAAIPLEPGSPVVGDGVVQYAPGDTVTLSYLNPGGSVLVRSYVIPPS
ncbi:MAG: hypothetical protein WD771_10280 [Gemmatimonadaceae bacterium]